MQGESRQHRKLQNHHRSPSGGDGQKPLPNPRDEIDVAHVCILRLSELLEQRTACAARCRTTNGGSDRLLSSA